MNAQVIGAVILGLLLFTAAVGIIRRVGDLSWWEAAGFTLACVSIGIFFSGLSLLVDSECS